jgi:RNA recognition motif-containing protein
MNIQVFNLSLNINDSDIGKLFSPFGVVNSAEIVRDKFSGRSKCNAFVEMPIETEARQAIASLDQSIVDGKKITVTQVATV